MDESPPEPPAAGAASTFVGRSDDLAELAQRVPRERLVTVVGPGGSGKARLVREAVHRRSFPVHGFIELAGIRSGGSVESAALAGCGFRDDPDRSPLEHLQGRFSEVAARSPRSWPRCCPRAGSCEYSPPAGRPSGSTASG